MVKQATQVSRRRFVKSAASAASALAAAPMFIPSSALGRDGAVAPSERIVVGGIGIGRRGGYDLSCFLPQKDVQFVAVADIKQKRRGEVKKIVDTHNGNENCDTYRDFRELLDRQDIDAVLIATGPNWHATAAMTAAKAGKDMYCEKPVTKNISQSLILADTMRRTGRVFQAGTQRRNLPHFAFACELARTGKLGPLKKVYAHPAGMQALMSGWLARRSGTRQRGSRLEYVPRDQPPGGRSTRSCSTVSILKRVAGSSAPSTAAAYSNGDLTALTSASGPLDDCPAARSSTTRPRTDELVARYENGTAVDIPRDRLDSSWAPALFGSKARTAGSKLATAARLVLSSPALLAGRTVEEIGGYPATFHVRDFLDCVKTRRQPKGNAQAACNAHIACHAANIALLLDRQVKYDNTTHSFINDVEANRLRSEALREPWRL